MTASVRDQTHDYCVYGLTIASVLRLPHLLPATLVGKPADVTIDFADLSFDEFGDGLSFRNWQAREGRLLFHAHAIGLFEISDGNRILVDRTAIATDADVVSIVLGTCMAALLQQRRILPLHSSAIVTDRGAVLTIGRSGAGKSTLLAGLLQAGCTMMADDVTGIVFDESGTPIALPAFPAMRLWGDSLGMIGHDSAPLARVRDDIEKFYLPVERFRADPLPVHMVILLTSNNDTETVVRPVPLAQRVECLARYVHRKNFLRGLGLQQYGFNTVTRLAQRIEMVSISRPSLNPRPGKMARHVLDHLAAADVGVSKDAAVVAR
ncbi:hypothetical protein [Flavisphingopyxis soli]|uniref:hypothetical protein n=1 Tax=Flavisphingopyxis soli TaxID=2601267 RepID=UPI001376105D|nr:hypothetical protein [Sphingorhabdus soli]